MSGLARRATPSIALLGAVLGGCGTDSDQVVVFAASSLTEAFTEIGEAFETASPGGEITFSFAASSELVTQIVEGAPADVYAAADPETMGRLTAAGGAAAEPVVFARNRSELVVAPGNPLGIEGVADLADPDLVLVTCAPEVPCGAYATRIFDEAGIEVTPDSYEENVKAVVTKVALGEADAGIAYTTDVAAADGDVEGVEIPDAVDVIAEYPLVVTAGAADPVGGRRFVDFVLSDVGQGILARHGFLAP